MGDRVTLKMIDGTLSSIVQMTKLTFERHGNSVYETSQGGYSKYVFGESKRVLYGKLQAILKHCQTMERVQNGN